MGKFRTTNEGVSITMAFAKEAVTEANVWDWRADLAGKVESSSSIDSFFELIAAEELMDHPYEARIQSPVSAAHNSSGVGDIKQAPAEVAATQEAQQTPVASALTHGYQGYPPGAWNPYWSQPSHAHYYGGFPQAWPNTGYNYNAYNAAQWHRPQGGKGSTPQWDAWGQNSYAYAGHVQHAPQGAPRQKAAAR